MALVATAGILELDSNGDLLLTVSHPVVKDDELTVLKSRSGLVNGKDARLDPFVCSRYGNSWHYILTTDATPESRGTLPRVDRFSIFVTTKDFCPEKYKELCLVLCRLHARTGNSVNLMKVYVDVMLKGVYVNKEENLSFKVSDFDPRRSLIASPLQGLVKALPDHFLLVWLAMLMRRRVFLLARSPEETLLYVRALPLFVWHRSSWGLLRPLVTSTDEEKADLEQAGIFCAGIVGEDSPLPRELAHGIFINMVDGRVDATQSGGDLVAFSQLQFVQDVGTAVVKCTEEQNDQALIKLLANKTKELLVKLTKIKDAVDGDLTLEALKGMGLPTGMPQFVFALAVAEGMV